MPNPSIKLAPGVGADKNAPSTTPVDPYGEILRLAKSTTSRSRFFSEVMRTLVRAFASPYGAVHARGGAEVIQDDAHHGPTDPNFWKAGLQEFLTDSLTEARSRAKLLQSKGGDTRVAFLSAPLFDPTGPSIGAVALVVPIGKEVDWTTRLAALEGLCRLASVCTEFLGGTPRTTTAQGVPLQGMAKAATCESPEQFAFSITNELRNKLGCAQIALGWVARKRVRILSISGLDQVNTRSPGVAAMQAAMEECCDAGAPIIHPRAGDWADGRAGVEYPLHRQWFAAAKGDAVASIALKSGEEVRAVLSLRGRSDKPFTPDQLDDLRSKLEPILPSFELVRRATRGLPRHTRDTLRGAYDGVMTPGRWGRKAALVVVLLMLGGVFFGSVNYHLTVPCTVTPAEVRHIHAVAGGVLQSARVMQGDRVRAGDVLCEFDHRELEQQRSELTAQLELLERERDFALASQSPAEAQLAMANQELVRAKLAIVDTKLAQSVVRSPIDGVVVRGDLRQAVGAVMGMGEPLFQVAPIDRWLVELEVPQFAAEDLQQGLSGMFATSAEPGKTTPLTVSRVHPAAQLRKNQTVYVAEADLVAVESWLKPGMEGVAKISVGPRRIAWVLTHRVLEYLQLHWWL